MHQTLEGKKCVTLSLTSERKIEYNSLIAVEETVCKRPKQNSCAERKLKKLDSPKGLTHVKKEKIQYLQYGRSTMKLQRILVCPLDDTIKTSTGNEL